MALQAPHGESQTRFFEGGGRGGRPRPGPRPGMEDEGFWAHGPTGPLYGGAVALVY